MYVTGKVAIVTGGVGGIGFLTAQHLLKNGAQYVAIFDVYQPDNPKVSDAAKKLSQEFSNDKFGYYKCDVTNEKEFIDRYEDVVAAKKYVDILINNAGFVDEKRPKVMIDINFTGVVNGTTIAIERMGKHKSGHGGAVVNIASFLGLINMPVTPVYNATKHAVVSLTRSLKEQYNITGVRVLCICPGMTKTNMTSYKDVREIGPEYLTDELIQNSVFPPLQNPNNVAAAILEILERGKQGDVWVAENNEPAYAVGEVDSLEKMRIPF